MPENKLQIKESTVYDWFRKGVLPGIILKDNPKKPVIRFREKTIENMVKSRERETRRILVLDRGENLRQASCPDEAACDESEVK